MTLSWKKNTVTLLFLIFISTVEYSDSCLLVSTDGSIHTNCTICPEGYYCPINSKRSDNDNDSFSHDSNTSYIISTPLPCGSPANYCPLNSTQPYPVKNGYYSHSDGGVIDDGSTITNPNTHTHQTIAPKGYYTIRGELFKCPPGTFGNETGLEMKKKDENSSSIMCSGKCHGGYYCPAGSTSPKQVPCGRYQYCPKGSAFPLFVQPGFYTTISNSHYDENDDIHNHIHTTRTTNSSNTTQKSEYELFQLMKPFTRQQRQYECTKGYFCTQAVRYPCFPGTYGNRNRETDSNCTGFCDAGYYCPWGSTSARQEPCGNPSYYCPTGSRFPIAIEPGFYSLSDNDEPFDRKTQQVICPKGHWCKQGKRHKCPTGFYGKNEGLSDSRCNGLCLPGFYCKEASTSNKQFPCGSTSVYCPIGSSSPKLTDRGRYSYNSSIVMSPSTTWTTMDEKLKNATMSWQRECEEGFYCVDGMKLQCPKGTFNNDTGMSHISDCKSCQKGYFCPTDPGNPSTNATAMPCGDINHYCPVKSHIPITVDIGYYSVGNGLQETETSLSTTPTSSLVAERYRTGQQICPRGSYCREGRKYLCPAGTFGNQTKLFHDLCSGFCPAGYFCKEGSSEPQECERNTYSTPGNSLCVRCNNPPPEGYERCKTSRLCCSQ